MSAHFADRFEKLPDAGRGELKSISPTVDQTAYCQIMAGIELGRRVMAASDFGQTKHWRTFGAENAIAYCREVSRD